jgi:hypothetical protein
MEESRERGPCVHRKGNHLIEAESFWDFGTYAFTE